MEFSQIAGVFGLFDAVFYLKLAEVNHLLSVFFIFI